LFADSFAAVIRGPEAGWTAASVPGMTPHLRDQIERWQNTNFAKYVRHATRRAPEHAGDIAAAVVDGDNWTEHGAPSQLASVLIGGMKAILREQLPTGEMPTYFRIGGGALEYRRTPLLSSFVHDALGTFDLRSRWVDTDFLDAFLLWEEGNGGGWWFNGRNSAAVPDADTTACAAAAVLQAPRRKPHPRHRTHGGLLRTHLAARNGGDGDVITQVNTLRCLALIGEPVDDVVAGVLTALRGAGDLAPAGHYAHPLVPAFCVARAWAHGALPGRSEVAELLVPPVLEYLAEPASGGPLGAALALNVLLDLEYSGAETIGAAQYLLDSALPRGGWSYAAFLENGGGAPALSTACAMSALARSGVAR
jgi:hypothetical protein